MTDLLRVVIDPNVFVSAVISPRGTTSQVVRAGFERRYRVVVCPHLLAELRDVLQRPSFRRYVSLAEVHELIDTIQGVGDELPDPKAVKPIARDPDDDYLLALADAASVELLVSGDKDLGSIPEPPVPVLTPRVFLDRLRLVG